MLGFCNDEIQQSHLSQNLQTSLEQAFTTIDNFSSCTLALAKSLQALSNSGLNVAKETIDAN